MSVIHATLTVGWNLIDAVGPDSRDASKQPQCLVDAMINVYDRTGVRIESLGLSDTRIDYPNRQQETEAIASCVAQRDRDRRFEMVQRRCLAALT